MVKDVDVRLLVTFEAVLVHGSITAAAHALGYVPSAVSQQIARLEHQLGVTLLHRSRTGSVPTAHGRAVRQAATTVLSGVAEFDHAIGALVAKPELRIGVFASAAAELLPQALLDLRRRDPQLAVRLVQTEPPQGRRALLAGAIDMLLAHRYQHEPVANDEGTSTTLIGTEPMHLCSAAPGRSLREALDHDWVAGTPGSPDRTMISHYCAEWDIRPHIAAETDDYHVAAQLISADLVVGFLPALLLTGSHAGLQVIATPEQLTRDIVATCRNSFTHPSSADLTHRLATALDERLTADPRM